MTKATIPATAGAAMLVPDFRVTPVFVRECAANTSWPGADISGFSRPSRVGPALEKYDNGVLFLCASYEPTTMVSRPQEMEPNVYRIILR